MSETILVLGATGQQGGATIKALAALDKGYKILALTRDPTSDKAAALEGVPNVELVKGDIGNIREVFEVRGKGGMQRVFLVLATFDHEEEERQGKSVVDLCVEFGVEQLVYSGVDLAGVEDTHVPGFESKRHIEQHITATLASTTVKYTIVRPCGFYEALLWPVLRHSYPSFSPPDFVYKFIAVEDIGKIVATALNRPAEYHGRILEIAGEAVTVGQLTRAWKEGTGETVGSVDAGPLPAPLLHVFEVFGAKYSMMADPVKTREEFPFVMDLETWIKKTDPKDNQGDALLK